MKSSSITIKDIAKALGLSYSTVSRALKDNYKISEPIRLKVQQYAKEHHYRPNLMAQSLKNQQSRSIGVCVSVIPNNFFGEVLSGIESVANEKDYKILITQNFESYEREMKNLEHMAWHSVDGILVSLSGETENIDHIRHLHEGGMPIVFFDRITHAISTHTVSADNEGGCYKATTHLIENGFTRIAHLTSSPDLSITSERLQGYQRALAEHNIPFNADLVKYCRHGGMLMEEIEQSIEELLALKIKPDALITASDRLTLGALSILHKKGIPIPSQVALAGFSNFSVPELLNPSVTTIRQPAVEMGKLATELLIKLIESKNPPKTFERKVLPTELIVRDSSKKLK